MKVISSRAGLLPIASACAVTLLIAVQCQAEVIYSTDFEGPVGSEWSTTSTDVTPLGSRRFLGQFYNQFADLTLNDLPEHTELNVSFDLFVIRSWDGNTALFGSFPIGPDIWKLEVIGGPVLLNTTFGGATQAYPDNYPGGNYPGYTGVSEFNTLGYFYNGFPLDAVYRLSFSFPHSGDSVAFRFADSLVQPAGFGGTGDEGWGIDNVLITVPQVPEPSTFVLAVVGVIGLAIAVRRDKHGHSE